MANKRVLGTPIEVKKDVPISKPHLVTANLKKGLSRKHFHVYTQDSECTLCNDKIKSNYFNCPICGLLFCHKDQPRYHMIINRSLKQVPYTKVKDTECYAVKCCSVCLYNSDGWLLPFNGGMTNDLTAEFNNLRNQKVKDEQLDTLILERRIAKLIDWIAGQIHRKQLKDKTMVKIDYAKLAKFEKDLCQWTSDNHRSQCEICKNGFGFFNRKHHCRICGMLVCADSVRGCSMLVPLGLICEIMDEPQLAHVLEKDDNTIRVCKDCRKAVFDKRVFELDKKKQQQSSIFQSVISWKTLETLIDKENLSIVVDDKQSNRLMSLFSRIDVLLKEISKMIDTNNGLKADEVKMLITLRISISEFIQEKLPVFRKSQEEKLQREQLMLKALNGEKDKPKLTKKEIRELRETLMVLTEQRFIIENMQEDLRKQRKFEDLKTLDSNLQDLNKEIDALQQKLGEEAF